MKNAVVSPPSNVLQRPLGPEAISQDQSDKFFEQIVAFIDRESGLDAPLRAEDEIMVRELLRRDPNAQRLADDLVAVNAGFEALCKDVSAVEVPDHLVSMIRHADFGGGAGIEEPIPRRRTVGRSHLHLVHSKRLDEK